MSGRINELMWSEADGIYLNKHWDGSFNRRISPTNFYPLLAGIASPERARRMVQQYLLNPQKFWGEYVVPTTPRDEPWPGGILAPTNYLIYEGLKRSGLDEVAAELAVKSTLLFLKEWQDRKSVV
jgi:neutral trehalase